MARRDLTAALLAITASGCTTIFGLESPQRMVDAGVVGPDDLTDPDAMVDAREGCYGTGLITVCLDGTIPPLIDIAEDKIDTGTDLRCRPEVSEYCVLAAQMVQLEALDAIGERPLVIIGVQSVSLDGEIDVGSARDIATSADVIGAGVGTPAQCGAPPAGENDVGGDSAGGGAGGTFGGRGGTGGTGNSGGGGMGAAALVPGAAPATLRGGCRGSSGGNAGNNGTLIGGKGGYGGGALYVVAGTSIQILPSAILLAGGEGGFGGVTGGSGGGGGGSGGFIGIDAPSIICQGAITANGGGGGEGGALSGNGQHGSSSLDPTVRAAGGSQNQYGGDGGRGSFTTTLDGETPGIGSDGAGGGGGGAGIIKVYGGGSLAGCSVSPPLT